MLDLTLHNPQSAQISEQGLDNVRKLIQADIDDGKVFGTTILVARHGKIVMFESFGTADGLRPSQNDDLYLSMSMGKAFTSAMLLRAVEQGRFKLDDKVCDILPEFVGGGKKHITVYQLLNHTSGLYGGKLIPPAPFTPADIVDLDKMYQAMCSQAVEFVPSERCAYSPFGNHTIQAKLIEKTDPKGRKFAQIMRDEVFAPLGMTETTYGNTIDNPRRVPVCYTPKMSTPISDKTAGFLNQFAQNGAVMAGGGNYLTALDTYRFAETLRLGGSNGDYRLLSSEMVAYATQNHTGELYNDAFVSAWLEEDRPKLRANFGLLGGYVRGERDELTVHGRNASPKSFGAMGGGSTMFMFDPEKSLTVVFLSSGFVEGLAHLDRVSKINDAVIACCA